MCEECKEKVRKVFLEDLPRKNGKCNKIDWVKTVGYKVPFIYDDIEGEIEILEFNKNNRKLTVKYNDITQCIKNCDFATCNIKSLIIKIKNKHLNINKNGNWIDLTKLQTNSYGVDWENSINCIVNFKYEDIEDSLKILQYNMKKQQLLVQYQNYKPILILTSGLLQCKIGTIVRRVTNEFRFQVGQCIKDDKRDLIIIDKKIQDKDYGYQKYNKKYYKYKCNKCGFECGEHYKNREYNNELWIGEGDLKKGRGCACCCLAPQVIVPEINSIVASEETQWMIPYFQGGYDEAKKYTKKSSQMIIFKCRDCERIKKYKLSVSNLYKNQSIGCSCSDGFSIPNKIMFSVLEQLNLNFKTEYSPQWIKPMRYDFYIELNDKKYIIEMDGGLGHEGGNLYSKSNRTLEELIAYDKYKDKQAEIHDIKVIRIDCNYSNFNKYDFVKINILNSELNNLCDLCKINWNECEEFALSNLCKKACEIKKNNSKMTTTDIGKILNLEGQTICKYLKYGHKIGWCYYNSKEEMKKNGTKNGGWNKKPVEILKDDISLGIFSSSAELSRQSERLFGIKLHETLISKTIRRHEANYKGFIFKYVEDDKQLNQ